jgi:OmpW family
LQARGMIFTYQLATTKCIYMKICLIACCLFLSTTIISHAQEFKPFKVGVGVGYAVPSTGKGAGGGVLFYVEPAYRPSDQFLVGLRLEGAALVRGVKGVNNNNDVSGDATTLASYTLNTQFYFTTDNVRPFIGAGLGLYSLAAVKFNTASSNDPTTDDVGAQTSFGFYPRVGLDAGHFNLTLDYNIVPSTKVPGGGYIKNNYLGIKLGVSIGGGKIE